MVNDPSDPRIPRYEPTEPHWAARLYPGRVATLAVGAVLLGLVVWGLVGWIGGVR